MAGELTDKEFEALLKETTEGPFLTLGERRRADEAAFLRRSLIEGLPIVSPGGAELGVEPVPLPPLPRLPIATLGGAIAGEEIGILAGTGVGAALAPAFPPAAFLGPVIGGGLGAAFGGFVGKLAQDTAEQISGAPEKPLGKQLREAAEEARIQGAIGAGGVAIGRTLRGGLLSRKLEEGAEEFDVLLRKFGGADAPAETIAKKTQARLPDIAEGVADGAFFSGNQFIRHENKINKVIDDMVESLRGTAPDEAGVVLIDALEGGESLLASASQKSYEATDRILGVGVEELKIIKQVEIGLFGPTGQMLTREQAETVFKAVGAKVNLRPVRIEAEKLFASIAEVEGFAAEAEILARIINLPNNITFGAAQRLRSGLLKQTRDAVESGVRQRIEGILTGGIDEAMEVAARTADPSGEALKFWRNANALWKMKAEKFNSPFIKALRRREFPDEVYASIIRGAGGPSRVKEIMRLVGPEAGGVFQRAYTEQLFSKAFSPALNQASGKSLLSSLTKGTEGRLSQEILTSEQMKGMKTIARGLINRQKKIVSPGRFAIMLLQVGAITGAATAVAVGKGEGVAFGVGGALLIGPNILARITTNSRIARFIVFGMTEPIGTRAGITAATRVFLAAKKAQKEIQREGRPREPVVPLQGPLAPIGPQAPISPGPSLPQPQSTTPTAVFGVRG
ncbi:hypothetical protein LCGC14_0992090 [marine sediment metagenome]|uniref:Uncharacterized protein n=1 Tax=marine sediment metagenome TaxID=412755 RepID=A0A0F9NA37_9ZZZZ